MKPRPKPTGKTPDDVSKVLTRLGYFVTVKDLGGLYVILAVKGTNLKTVYLQDGQIVLPRWEKFYVHDHD